MLRFHIHRLIFAAVVLAPLIAGGMLLGAAGSERQSVGMTISSGIEQHEDRMIEAAAVRSGNDQARRVRSAELSWPFFSFGRRGTL